MDEEKLAFHTCQQLLESLKGGKGMTPANEQEYRLKREMLLEKIAFNEKIRCHLVAARYRRELEELDRLWEQRKD